MVFDRTASPSSIAEAARWPTTCKRSGLSHSILFVRRSGSPWRMLPKHLGYGSGMTWWRRLRDWQQAGIWDLMHFVLLNWLSRGGQIDWSRAVVDSRSVRALFGGCKQGRIRPIKLNPQCSLSRHLIPLSAFHIGFGPRMDGCPPRKHGFCQNGLLPSTWGDMRQRIETSD